MNVRSQSSNTNGASFSGLTKHSSTNAHGSLRHRFSVAPLASLPLMTHARAARVVAARDLHAALRQATCRFVWFSFAALEPATAFANYWMLADRFAVAHRGRRHWWRTRLPFFPTRFAG